MPVSAQKFLMITVIENISRIIQIILMGILPLEDIPIQKAREQPQMVFVHIRKGHIRLLLKLVHTRKETKLAHLPFVLTQKETEQLPLEVLLIQKEV